MNNVEKELSTYFRKEVRFALEREEDSAKAGEAWPLYTISSPIYHMLVEVGVDIAMNTLENKEARKWWLHQ